MDLARAQLPVGLDELVAGEQHRDPRPPRADRLGDPAGRQRAELGSADSRPRLDDHGPGRRGPRRLRRTLLPGGTSARIETRPSPLRLGVLDPDHRIGARRGPSPRSRSRSPRRRQGSTAAGWPARDSPTIRSERGALRARRRALSAARTANPSIAELSKPGTATRERAGSARTRPSAAAQRPAGSGSTNPRTVARARRVDQRLRAASIAINAALPGLAVRIVGIIARSLRDWRREGATRGDPRRRQELADGRVEGRQSSWPAGR